MSRYREDTALCLLVGVGIYVAALAISPTLDLVVKLTEVTPELEPEAVGKKESEKEVNVKTLEALIKGSSHELSQAALEILLTRAKKLGVKQRLLHDLTSRDQEVQDKAITLLHLYATNRSLTPGMKVNDALYFADSNGFNAVITALVNLIPVHFQLPRLSDLSKAVPKRSPEIPDSVKEHIRTRLAEQQWDQERVTLERRVEGILSLLRAQRSKGDNHEKLEYLINDDKWRVGNGDSPEAYLASIDEAVALWRWRKGKEGRSVANVTSSPSDSPVMPLHRPAQEKKLLEILREMLSGGHGSFSSAIDAGLVYRWLRYYPFPWRYQKEPADWPDLVDIFQQSAWGNDDQDMGFIILRLRSSRAAMIHLKRYRLTKTSRPVRNPFQRGGPMPDSDDSDDSNDIVMTGGEDTAGVPLSALHSRLAQRPGSSWAREPPASTPAEAAQRRARREAMVISDGREPLTRENILQRENSRSGFVPSANPEIEEQLARLSREIDREDEDARRRPESWRLGAPRDWLSRARELFWSAERQPAIPAREPLVDITDEVNGEDDFDWANAPRW